ncbi:FAD binding domain-containing protein [Alteribacillus iranensis]|uniref:Carbon-monoxide dehydrogenase medium subunit/2-furoyl-CoA dehydrogenase FAD binding subunit n=1 Tax=Alteribacillus iranensis TaxID=930128 RepID=A0A1I2F064_9BACI|nr:xanthine dehydrogenase family protein subunit M [Alteribacillus iranensis]SFE98804.1 carbon-monoxide dehydrogenase medium subunit/2-furoyl-CoA dehydrogenase FAD binding subunit [Alteribacillus iranensis]
MKPATFQYVRPESVRECLEYLSMYGDEAKIIAGGQSLIPVMNMRLSTPEYLIDISRLEELNYIRHEGDFLHIGGGTRQIDVETSSLVKTYNPLLRDAIRHIGHSQIRTRGTVGGSISHGDPSAELPLILAALRGEIVVVDEEETANYTADEFYLTTLLTALEPQQMVSEIVLPVLSPQAGYAFIEETRRQGDFALVSVAAVLEIDSQNLITKANVGIGGAHEVPYVAEELEEYLIGKEPTDSTFEKASEEIKDSLEPETDLHGTAEYRMDLAVELTKRALRQAAGNVEGALQ